MLVRLEKRKLTIRVIGAGLCGALITSLIGFGFIHRVQKTYQDETVSNLSANVKILANSFDSNSHEQQAALKSMASRPIIADGSYSLSAQLEELSRFAERRGFVRAGIATLDGVANSSDNGTANVSDREWFKKAKAGQFVVSSSLYDRLGSGEDIIVFAQPVRRNNRIEAVLFAAQYTAEYFNTSHMELLDRVNKVIVFSDTGKILVGNDERKRTNAFFADVKNASKSKEYKNFRSDISKGYTGSEQLSFDGISYETVYAPLKQHKGWYVLMALEQSDLNQATYQIMSPLYLWVTFAMLVVALLSGFIAFLFTAFFEERKESERLRDENDLFPEIPGIKSRSSLVRDINEFYPKMKPDELAIVGTIHIESLDSYRKIFGEKSLLMMRQTIAEKVSNLKSRSCEIAYCGNDVYLIFAKGFYARKECRDYMLRVQAAVNESFDFRGFTVRIASKAGAKIYFRNDESAKSGDALINCAEYALKVARNTLSKSVAFYDFDLNESQQTANKLRRDLPGALKREELCMVYQPEYNLETQEVVGFEALLRWRHPELGIVLPDDFIPIAVEEGYIVEIGRWVIDQVFSDARDLGSPRCPISYNVSSSELLAEDYADYTEERFSHYGLKPHTVALELSDKNIFVIYQQVQEPLERLRAKGINIYLDNFGWWMDSTRYLTQLPLDSLKVSQLYCDVLKLGQDSKKILDGMVSISKACGVNAAAKGIVNEQQGEALSLLGFEYGQGNYYSRPLTFALAKELADSKKQDDLPSGGETRAPR